MKLRFVGVVLMLLSFFSIKSIGQTVSNPSTILGADSLKNPITTAVPFILIGPDARASGMGDAGVATSPDAASTHWNVAKLAFLEKDYGVSLSYSPWLSKIINDMSLSDLTGFYKITREQTVALSLRYFDLGEIVFTDQNFQSPGAGTAFNPREFAVAASYGRMLTEQFSIGVTAKFIHSNLTGSFTSSLGDTQPGNSVAADIGVYYNKDIRFTGKNAEFAWGASITNIGSKISYTGSDSRDFIPTNLRFGGALTTHLDPYNKLTITTDFNKLMVPTPPIRDDNGNIVSGEDPDRSLLSGIFGSFSDAPGGFSEELREITISAGAEYWYNETFAARLGYFYEHVTKGNRKYITLGLGFRYQKFGVDFAYLVPPQQEHPLAETLRFTLLFNFDKVESERESVTD